MKIVAASSAEVEPQRAWPEMRAEHGDVLFMSGDNVSLEGDDHADALASALELRQRDGPQFAELGFSAALSELRARRQARDHPAQPSMPPATRVGSSIHLAVAGFATSAQREIFMRSGKSLTRTCGSECILLAGTDFALVFKEGGTPGFETLDFAGLRAAAIAAATTAR